MSESAKPAVLVETRGNVLIATINRPEARNAVNIDVHVGLGLALEQAESDVEIRAVILTGAGELSFCAGADLKMIARGEKIRPKDKEQAAWGFAGFVKHPISKPVIGAINGFALGGGTELALACDMIVAADHAKFGLPEVKRGIIASAGGTFRLVQQLPRKIAMEQLLVGDAFTAQQAKEWGLVNYVVPASELMQTALDLAQRIAANAPLAVQASKRIAMGIEAGAIESDAAHWARTDMEVAGIYTSEDAREGPRAFAEKRAPQWKGR